MRSPDAFCGDNNRVNRLSHMLTVLSWILLAGALFFLFGLMVGSEAGRAVVSLGWLPESRRLWVTDSVWAASGLLLLGLSFVYRRLASQDNAGSFAAWLAGWALLLYGVSSLLAAVNGVLVVALLVAILAVWEVRKMIALGEAAANLGGPPPDVSDMRSFDAEGGAECDPPLDAEVDDKLAAEVVDEADDEADDDLGGLDPHIGVSRGDAAPHERVGAERHTNVGGPCR
jgi:hypothetical protein